MVDRSIVWLDEPGAADARLSGAKASNLAIARQNGLPVYDGFVIVAGRAAGVIAAAEAIAAQERTAQEPPVPNRARRAAPGTIEAKGNGHIAQPSADPALFAAWAQLSRAGTVPLVVRSSSVIEDSVDSSMAGRFLTVLHVSCWADFLAAAADVLASAGSVPDRAGATAPMAVLVQPMGEASTGGVLFGVDPLTGDESTYLVSFAAGSPDQIVSGVVNGTQLRITRRGRSRSTPRTPLDPSDTRQLAALARSTERLFGGPQDIEWLIDGGGALHLLQSRPITASAVPVKDGHLLGSGPVSETFTDPLSRLETDLWAEPLDEGIREALRISGTISQRGLAERFVVNVGGRVAVDLEALGIEPRPSRWWHRLDPFPPARRVRAAWRIGRLRVALPAITHDLVNEVDGHLRSLPALDELGDVQLLTILDNTRRVLSGLHAHEVMAGFFLDPETTTSTGASVALTTVARARLDGMDDAEIIACHPIALALLAPRIAAQRTLPPTPSSPPGQEVAPPTTLRGDDAMGIAREALRLRVRWVQELGAQVSMELGRRLLGRGQLGSAEHVRHLGMADLRSCVDNPATPAAAAADVAGVAPLPSRFRLARDGSVVPALAGAHPDGAGSVGVSGGRVVGVVTHDPANSNAKVLVVATLDPALAGVIGAVAGLVSESGSPLSHLAILAREYRVPAVAAMAGATDQLCDGDVVLVDGTTGTVEVIADESPHASATFVEDG